MWKAKEARSADMKTNTHSLILSLLVVYFASLPGAQAVSPAPDGCYPNFTTAEGCNALQSLTTGIGNTGIGSYSLLSNSFGNFNTAVGAGALDLNTAGNNTAIGAAALLLNTTGFQNTATGVDALANNGTGNFNTASGVFALFSNTSGSDNTAIGREALSSNTGGSENIAIGDSALLFNATGADNVAIGFSTMLGILTGNNNIAIGNSAGINLNGDNNIDIGNNGVPTDANTIRIGGDVGYGPQTATFIAAITGVAVVGDPVVVDANGQLGTATSSARFKREIRAIDNASEAILALKPVTFQYKSDSKQTPQFGLIAEEVAKVNPDLVTRDRDGKIYSVRYEAVNAMLLNEFLKEHRKVEQMQEQIEALTAGLQKVSAQLELSKAAPQTVATNR